MQRITLFDDNVSWIDTVMIVSSMRDIDIFGMVDKRVPFGAYAAAFVYLTRTRPWPHFALGLEYHTRHRTIVIQIDM